MLSCRHTNQTSKNIADTSFKYLGKKLSLRRLTGFHVNINFDFDCKPGHFLKSSPHFIQYLGTGLDNQSHTWHELTQRGSSKRKRVSRAHISWLISYLGRTKREEGSFVPLPAPTNGKTNIKRTKN